MGDPWVAEQLDALGLAPRPDSPATAIPTELAEGVHVQVTGGPHALTEGVIIRESQIPGDVLVASDGTGGLLSVPAKHLRPWAQRAFNPKEARGFHGRWEHVGGSSFNFEGPPGGDGHVRAIMATADDVDRQPGMQDAATDIRNAARAMVRRDMPAANRHLDGAAYLDGIYAGGTNRNRIEAIRRSFAAVPKGAVTEPGLVSPPPELNVKYQRKLKGQPVPAGIGTYAARAFDPKEARDPGGKWVHIGTGHSLKSVAKIIHHDQGVRPDGPALLGDLEKVDQGESPVHQGRFGKYKLSPAGYGKYRVSKPAGQPKGVMIDRPVDPEGGFDAYARRAFDPNEARDPHSGEWIVTGRGLANHLHGKPVVGRHENGMDVHGTYAGKGYVRPAGGGPPIPVTHVRPADKKLAPERTRVPVGAGPLGGGAFSDYTRRAVQIVERALGTITPEPRGKPGGPGLYHLKGKGHAPYFQHIVNDLIESGHPEPEAYSLAWGILRNFAAGHDGKGNRVHPDTQAKAVAALAFEQKRRAEAKATRSTTMPDTHDADGLDASWDGDLEDLPDLTGLTMDDLDAAAAADPEQFAGWLAGGTAQRAAKLGSGARFAALKAKLAGRGIRDPGALAAHIGRQKYGKARFHALASAARKRKGGPSMARSEIFRYWPLEECRILSRSDGEEYGSGRVVEAYAAVFEVPAEIRDHEGHYVETIDGGAFHEVIRTIHPDRNGGFWNATCLYNHGMTVHGTPAERFSLPAGLPRWISAEGKGLLTRTEYANTPLGEELLELVNMGALRSQSFTGGIIRSTPMLRGPGDRYPEMTRVRRMQLGLREYGLTPFAAYSGAEVLGVRMQLPGDLDGPQEEYEDAAAPVDDGGHGGSPEAETVSRSTSNRLYRLRTQEALERAGITLPGRAGEEQ